MSETQWEDRPVEKKKRGPLFWVLGSCGCGCLLLLIALVVVAVFGVRIAKEASNPERAWPKVAEVLPFDDRPEGMSAFYIDWLGVEMLQISNGLTGSISLFHSPAEADAFFEPESLPGTPEVGSVHLQGRDVRAVWFQALPEMPGILRDWMRRLETDVEGMTQAVGLDLSTPDRGIFLQVLRSEAPGEPTRISEEEIEAFLEPFDVWRGR